MKKTFLIKVSLLLALVLNQGCATFDIHRFQVKSKRPPQYTSFYRKLDEVIKDDHAQNSANVPVKGFPYLRSNRMLVALKDDSKNGEQRRLWIEKLRELDLKERIKEINNLSEESVIRLATFIDGNPSRVSLIDKTEELSKKFLQYDINNPDFYPTLDKALQNRSQYSLAMRTVGLYPLFSIPVYLGTIVVYNEYRHWHQQPLEEIEVDGQIKSYVPGILELFRSEDALKKLSEADRDSLGFPILTAQDIKELIWALAPHFDQDEVAEYDRFGEVVWKDGRVSINTNKPTVYYYGSYAIHKGQPVLQLNYTIWYTGRRGSNAPIIERGRLDGLTYRVTLDHDGLPLIADIMNTCGCYHFFVPNDDKILGIKPENSSIETLVPTSLPSNYPEEKIALRINSGWHQVQRIYPSDLKREAEIYDLVPYPILENLPHPDGRMESVFNPIGIMKDSHRVEPLIFFPMGIYEVGYMRQRGHHAIKLIGRGHFTDPYLFEKNFDFR